MRLWFIIPIFVCWDAIGEGPQGLCVTPLWPSVVIQLWPERLVGGLGLFPPTGRSRSYYGSRILSRGGHGVQGACGWITCKLI